MGTMSRSRTLTSATLPSQVIKNWEEYFFLESAEEIHDIYMMMTDILRDSYVNIPLGYEDVCEIISSAFKFIREHAVCMLRVDACMWCDEDDPYRASCEEKAYRTKGLMSREDFGIAFELPLYHMYSALSTFFKQVRNHAVALEHFKDDMYALYKRRTYVSTAISRPATIVVKSTEGRVPKMQRLRFGQNYKKATQEETPLPSGCDT